MLLLNPACESAALDSIRHHLLDEPAASSAVATMSASASAAPRPVYCRSTSFGSLVADQWSESLPFRPDDADDMVVFGALRDAFSRGWLPDGSFAAVKPEPLAASPGRDDSPYEHGSYSSYLGGAAGGLLLAEEEPETPTEAAAMTPGGSEEEAAACRRGGGQQGEALPRAQCKKSRTEQQDAPRNACYEIDEIVIRMFLVCIIAWNWFLHGR
ncbi:unnamed protein product [Miscanthus lutarioriparius]|uniref:Uncharacterized protein n=1 Tax=Miscanthus lutarioriparius TaxID=422564 RepID=A0A811Q0F2_9POAL|nr:unnamed protein product [Miscanthus lutarioriparius]